MEVEKLKLYQLDFDQFQQNYVFVTNCSSIPFGDYKIMKNAKTNQDALVKQQQTQNLQETQELLQTIQEINIKLNENNNFLRFIGFSEAPYQQRPSPEWNLVYLIFEYYPYTIEQQWEICIQKEGIEDLIKRLFNSLNECFLMLESIGQYHTDISMQNILCFYSEKEKNYQFKLIYTQYTTSAYRQVKEFQQEQQNYFLAPEIIQNKLNELNLQKIDAFAFGQLLLFLSSFKSREINMKQKQFLNNPDFVNKLFSIIQSLFSVDYLQILKEMTNEDPKCRPTFIEILRRFKQMNISKDQLNKSNSLNYFNLVSNLERLPLQERAQEIKNEIFCTKKKFFQKSIDEQRNQRCFSWFQGKAQKLKPQFATPSKNNNAIRIQESIKKMTISPISQSPYQRSSFNLNQIVNNSNTNFNMRKSDFSNRSFSQKGQYLEHKEQFDKFLKNLENKYIYDNFQQLKPNITKKEYLDGSLYIGEIAISDEKQEIREGNGIYYYNNSQNIENDRKIIYDLYSEIYAGSWKNNVFEGEGVYLFSTGERYEGELHKGQKHGKGQYYYANKNHYQGEWYNDLKHGYGIFTLSNLREKYEGEFQNGLRHGNGNYYYNNGDVFKGQWEYGEKNGHGEVFFQDGSYFSGEWKGNQPNGFGKIIYSNGDIYEGNFVGGIKEGNGIYLHKQANSKFLGAFRCDEPFGFGKFFYGNGDGYEGEVKGSQRYGKGLYTYANGETYEGEWKCDKKNGQGIFYYQDGSVYNGSWNQGQFKGQGIMNYSDGSSYKGEWMKGKKHGQGIYKWKNGAQYNGSWKNDKINGKGVFTNQNQKSEGIWVDNQLINKI